MAGTPKWIDPIDVLQDKYDAWLVWLGQSLPSITPYQPQIFPNPAEDEVTINWTAGGASPDRFRIIDMKGRIVLEGKITVDSAFRIDIKGLQAGTYLLLLNRQRETLTASRLVIGR